jgi:hypothetical protein
MSTYVMGARCGTWGLVLVQDRAAAFKVPGTSWITPTFQPGQGQDSPVSGVTRYLG